MRHMGNISRATILGVGVLAAGLVTAGPAGAVTARPAASGTTYDLETVTTVRALGHTWDLNIGATKAGVEALIQTGSKAVTEFHGWSSTKSFAPTAARILTMTGADHATLKTGGTLSPVLTASLAFTPVKAQNVSCASGSAMAYTGYMTGRATLATGLRGVKISVTFGRGSGQAILHVSHSCVLPATPPCIGGAWSAGSAGLAGGTIGTETPGARPSWGAALVKGQVRTGSRYLVRSDQVIMAGGQPAPRLNAAAHTVMVATSGAISGSAVIRYRSASRPPAATCYVGRQAYTASGVQYTGSASTTRPFQAHTILTGTLSMRPGGNASYADVTLTPR